MGKTFRWRPNLRAVARHPNPADRGRGITLAGLDRRQAPRHAERRARVVVAAVHDVPSRSQRLGKLQVLENGLLWATEKDALCQQPLPGAGTTGVKFVRPGPESGGQACVGGPWELSCGWSNVNRSTFASFEKVL